MLRHEITSMDSFNFTSNFGNSILSLLGTTVGGEGEKESTTKARSPSKNIVPKHDDGTTSFIGKVCLSFTP